MVETAVCQSCGIFIYPAGHPMLGRRGGGIAADGCYCLECIRAYGLPAGLPPVTVERCEVCLAPAKNCRCGDAPRSLSCSRCGKFIKRGERCWACYKKDLATGGSSGRPRKEKNE